MIPPCLHLTRRVIEASLRPCGCWYGQPMGGVNPWGDHTLDRRSPSFAPAVILGGGDVISRTFKPLNRHVLFCAKPRIDDRGSRADVLPSLMLNDEQVPTIGSLARMEPRWVWAYCDNVGCGHISALPLVPFVIRWGAKASSNLIRRNLTCSKCGTRGVSITLPSQLGSHGPQTFPVERAVTCV